LTFRLNFADDSFHGSNLEGYYCSPVSVLHVGLFSRLRFLTTEITGESLEQNIRLIPEKAGRSRCQRPIRCGISSGSLAITASEKLNGG
jgi:hypothetical protein